MEMDEATKRRELQLLLLREGYTQDEAREMATTLPIERLDKKWLAQMREDARFPERQIVPPGTVDLADVKSQREDALMKAAEAEYYENRDKLGVLITQLFSVSEMPLAVLQTLLNVLEATGADRLDAITEVARTIEELRRFYEWAEGNEV